MNTEYWDIDDGEIVDAVNCIVCDIREHCPRVYREVAAGNITLLEAMQRVKLSIRIGDYEWDEIRKQDGISECKEDAELLISEEDQSITDADIPF